MRKSEVLSLSTTVRAMRRVVARAVRARSRPRSSRRAGGCAVPVRPAAGRARRCPRRRSAASGARARTGLSSMPSDSSCRRRPQRPKCCSSSRRAERAQVGDGGDAQLGEPRLHDLADAGQAPDRQRREEGLDLVRADHEQAVGLAPVRGDLGQELVRRDAGRGGELRLLADRGADRLGGRGGGGQAGLGRGDVEVGLVERQRLDQVGVAREDLAHLPRHRLVARRNPAARTPPAGTGARRGSPASPSARRTCAPRSWPRTPPSARRARRRRPAGPRRRRVVALLDRRVERVHVDVEDLAARGGDDGGHGRDGRAGRWSVSQNTNAGRRSRPQPEGMALAIVWGPSRWRPRRTTHKQRPA